MTRRAVLASAFALLMAAIFARLGVWQLHRLHDRRAWNTLVASRLRSAPVDLAALPPDTAHNHYRLVHVTGRFDFDHEIALANRTRDGAPGVDLLTPMRPDDGDSAVLVDRGWVYSPDASSVDFARWREPAHQEVIGYVEELPTATEPPRADTLLRPGQRSWRHLDATLLRRMLPYPLAGVYLMALPDSVARASVGAQLNASSAPDADVAGDVRAGAGSGVGSAVSSGAAAPAPATALPAPTDVAVDSRSGAAGDVAAAAPAAGSVPSPNAPLLAPPSAVQRQSAPVRHPLPVLGEGPHLSYAIQWFFFAAVALSAIVVLVRQERRRNRELRIQPPDLWSEP